MLVFETLGWLVRHIKSNHAVLAEAAHAITPPGLGQAWALPNSSERVRHRVVLVEARIVPPLVVSPGILTGRQNPVQLKLVSMSPV